MTHIKASITGIQGYVPDYILTNAELETMVATNDEWIVSRTGIKERRILKGEGLGSSHMGAEAVKGLLAKTNTRPDEIDLLICATTTPDFIFPCTPTLSVIWWVSAMSEVSISRLHAQVSYMRLHWARNSLKQENTRRS
jgi:3-oxoacyl-[acyl-carrier-protein] synthase-3